jgi:prolyl-tRNA editing enzyme YbaK/EbsC (Cys-tRNA(Pro) deacylase)
MTSRGASKVQTVLDQLGFSLQVVELPESTRTAKEAAQTIGCQVGQIAKSLVFQTVETGRPLLVIASGINQVDEARIAEYVGEKIRKADAGFVRQHTGFAIGGVPPLGHEQPLLTFIDRDLLRFGEIWAAAGTPHAVFRLTGEILVSATGGRVIEVTG